MITSWSVLYSAIGKREDVLIHGSVNRTVLKQFLDLSFNVCGHHFAFRLLKDAILVDESHIIPLH